jgi:hypothetical protein
MESRTGAAQDSRHDRDVNWWTCRIGTTSRILRGPARMLRGSARIDSNAENDHDADDVGELDDSEATRLLVNRAPAPRLMREA